MNYPDKLKADNAIKSLQRDIVELLWAVSGSSPKLYEVEKARLEAQKAELEALAAEDGE